ncbi:MAG TPA: hypothetical protein VND93_17575 [Myxococcales bacterium]|nr:hypothetical protein [Myxococcales bacterium]
MAPPAGDKAMGGMMEGYTPRKVTKEDKKGIEAAGEAMHKAMIAGNMDEAMKGYDFPIFMMTDDKDGVVYTNMADAATWKKMMAPMMDPANKAMMDAMAKMPKPKMDMFFLTDNMAVVTAKGQMPMGKEKMEMRNSMLMIKKGDVWMVKGEMEGGWGDAAKKMMDQMKSEMKPAEMKPTAGTGGQTKGMK